MAAVVARPYPTSAMVEIVASRSASIVSARRSGWVRLPSDDGDGGLIGSRATRNRRARPDGRRRRRTRRERHRRRAATRYRDRSSRTSSPHFRWLTTTRVSDDSMTSNDVPGASAVWFTMSPVSGSKVNMPAVSSRTRPMIDTSVPTSSAGRDQSTSPVSRSTATIVPASAPDLTRATSRYSSMSPASGTGVDQLIQPLWASHSVTELPSAVYTNGPKPQRDLLRLRIERLIARPSLLSGVVIDDDERGGPRLVGDRSNEDDDVPAERAESAVGGPPILARLRIEGDDGVPVGEQQGAVAVDLLDRSFAFEAQLPGRHVVHLEVRLVTDHHDFVVGVDGRRRSDIAHPQHLTSSDVETGQAVRAAGDPRGGVLVEKETVAGDGDVAPAWRGGGSRGKLGVRVTGNGMFPCEHRLELRHVLVVGDARGARNDRQQTCHQAPP